MKRHLLTTAAMLLGLAALAAPAASDVTVTGTVFKDVDIFVFEDVLKFKTVDITVVRDFGVGQSAAEAVGVHNQRINNTIYRRDCDPCDVTTDPVTGEPTGVGDGPLGPGGNHAVIGDPVGVVGVPGGPSFTNNTGIVLWNQDVGAFNNQANVVTAAIVGSADFAEAFDAVAQHTENNQAFVFGFLGEGPAPGQTPTKSAQIVGSVNDNTGVMFINQNAGVASNQYNSLTLAFGVAGASIALAEAELGQWNINNHTFEINSIRSASITDSVNGNTGVTSVNQNVGNFNNQAFKLSVAGGIGSPSPGLNPGIGSVSAGLTIFR